jgi:hypothetical protein
MDLSKASVQELNFELMKRASFNGFDGVKVVKSLIKHRELWESVVMDGECIVFPRLESRQSVHDIYWIKLRDMSDNLWNVDTLFIIPNEGCKDELFKIARRWYADEIDYVDVNMGGRKCTVLRLWWD